VTLTVADGDAILQPPAHPTHRRRTRRIARSVGPRPAAPASCSHPADEFSRRLNSPPSRSQRRWTVDRAPIEGDNDPLTAR
jgi:hypothetical protein